jgi:serine/threonine-protein kinase
MSSPSLWSRFRAARLGRVLLVYAGASWAVLEATDFFIDKFGLPNWFLPAVLDLLLVGIVVLVATALVQSRPARAAGSESDSDDGDVGVLFTWRNAIVGGALGLLGMGTAGWLLSGRDDDSAELDPKSVAVLPFANMSAEEENEYFSDGITDDIITHLSKIADLKVISRTSVMRYKDTEKSIREIGEELGVATILEGGVRRSGDRVRINAQLIDATRDEHLWAEIYDRDLTDVFAIQSDVAQQIANALHATLTPTERAHIERRPTENLEAYDLYLRGNAYLRRWAMSTDAATEAERLYRMALELDPDLAVAWAKISRAHSGLYWSYVDRNPERLTMAREAFERAFQIEPGLAEAHVAAGFYYYYGSRDYQRALEEFEAAIAVQPNNVDAVEGTAWVYRRLGEWDRAVENLKKAAELDPGDDERLQTACETLYYQRRYEEAERYCVHSLAVNPNQAHASRVRGWIYASWTGDVSRTWALVEEALTAAPGEALAGADDLQPWWLVRVIASDADRLADRLSVASFADDTVAYQLAIAQLSLDGGDGAAVRAAYESAAAILEGLIAEQPGDARYHSELGVAYAGLGREVEAIREGKRAVELLPVSRDALWGRAFADNLAWIYVTLGRHDDALEQLEFVLSLPAGPVTPSWLPVDPAWDPLRDLPRFQRLTESDR